MIETRRTRLRTALAVLVAIAQPAMAVRPYIPASRAVVEPGCHMPAPGRQDGPGHSVPSRGGFECVICCCIPSAVLVSAPVDSRVLFVSIPGYVAPDLLVRERPCQPPPHLLPFAIAPPAIA